VLYWYIKRGVVPPPTDPVLDSFPFIGAPRFTCQEFLLTPSLWGRLFGFADKIDHTTLPEPIQQFLFLGEGGNDRTKRNVLQGRRQVHARRLNASNGVSSEQLHQFYQVPS
jgi:hypothetical protein